MAFASNQVEQQTVRGMDLCTLCTVGLVVVCLVLVGCRSLRRSDTTITLPNSDRATAAKCGDRLVAAQALPGVQHASHDDASNKCTETSTSKFAYHTLEASHSGEEAIPHDADLSVVGYLSEVEPIELEHEPN
ncbi:MAG: hypothetical protein AAGG44_13840, partial [Planctomycetota bacterium]